MNHPARAPRRRSLRLATITMLMVSIAVTLTVLLHLALVSHFAHQQARKEAQLRLQQLSWQMRDSLNRVTNNAIVTVKLLADLPQIRSYDQPEATRSVLESIQREVPDYAWIGVVDAKGKVRASTGRMLEGAQVEARPWFQAGLKGAHATDYHPALLLNKLLPKAADPWRFIDMSAPLLGADGQVRGVVGVHMSWQWARNRARQLLTPALREYGAEVLVVRADGTVILGPEHLIEKKIDTPSLRLAQTGATGSLREEGADGRIYLTGYSRTGTTGDPATLQWAVLVRHTEDAALADARALEDRMIVLSVLMALVLAGCAALLARRLTRPMDALSGAIEQAAAATRAGGRPQDIPVVDGFHEANVLSHAMRELVRSEEAHRSALETMNQQLESTVAARTAELQALLLHDALTGLPNRRALMQTLPDAMHRAVRAGKPCALLFLDMDGFKGVNDTHGHEEGDELLRQFGARLFEAVRKTDLVARLAGDEFVVVLEGLADAQDAHEKANSLLEVLRQPYALRRASVTVGASIGVALHRPGEAHDLDAWLARADNAMYAAKRGGKNAVALAA
ncbi:sensor domain-containing diguanylate cyclase [Massilia sp. Mn16-1_5]|uniref:sensor domain-containing diguanylate cyclase n=1 Tax=Massilia sp. Mn16-1_5 TaxID=2079199 RepID=UPI00109EAB89|nr:sensor domain-containing diguanylate cyclase [Massilia sp. Mn16-1_5]THC39880.1 GGDEF domain-containing protein [Massilia sp. Mn16-1_5]